MTRSRVEIDHDGKRVAGTLVRDGGGLEFQAPLHRLHMDHIGTLYSHPTAGKRIAMAIMVAIALALLAWATLPPVPFAAAAVAMAILAVVVVRRLRRDLGWLFVIGTADGEEHTWRIRDREDHDDRLSDFLQDIEENP